MQRGVFSRNSTGRDARGLIFFLLVCLVVSGIGGAITASSVETWYQTLDKPFYNPPDWVFAPVWTLLYIFMAVAGWRVWRTPRSPARFNALLLYAVQLVLNLVWSLLFFGFQQIGMAMVEITTLLLTLFACILVFSRLDRLAGALFVPYALWVAYAAVLNFSLWILN